MGPGTMRIELGIRDGFIRDVTVSSRRPQISSLLVGQSCSGALQFIPMIYSVCRRAQRAAAQAAMNAAGGARGAAEIDREVAAEAARELGLSVLTGEAKEFLPSALRSLTIRAHLQSLLEGPLLGCPIAEWLSMASGAHAQRWARVTDAALAREYLRRMTLTEVHDGAPQRLPALDACSSLEHWPVIDARFAAEPVYNGEPAQSGPICRAADHPLVCDLHAQPLLQHWIARLVDWVRFACGDADAILGRVSAASARPGHGRSTVETARGMLMHDVEITADRVERYVMVAPTEWNFHPQGAARRWLQALPVNSMAQALDITQRVAEALDPCVRCECMIA